MKSFALVVVAVLALSLLTGCARNVAGTYTNNFTYYTLILNDDHTGSLKRGFYGLPNQGTYTVEGNEVILKYPVEEFGKTKVAVWHFTIDKNSLVCEDGVVLRKQ